MAIIKNGINGAFSGKVGNVVGTTWRGLAVIRSKPAAPTHFSEKQLANQMKMKLVQLFLKHLVPALRIGFKNDDIIPTAFNTALSYNKKNALVGEYPNLSIDFSLIRVAQGALYLPEDLTMLMDDAGLHFSWDKTLQENAKKDDQLMVVTWNEAQTHCEYFLQAYRNAGQFSCIPQLLIAGTHVWAAFIRHDRSLQSNSAYLGML